MNKLIPLSLLLLIVFSACKKEKDEEPAPSSPEPGYVNEDLTTYSMFKTGTYWIYKDSTSGAEDSVYVYTDTSFQYHQTGTVQAEGDYMFYNCQAHSYYDGYDYIYKLSMGNYSIATGQVATVRIRIKPADYMGETFLLSSCFQDGIQATWYLGAGTIYYKAFYENMSVSGTTYASVVKFFDTNNATEYNSPTNFYIAKNIGIIRKEKTDSNQVWNLIRFNIIQ